MIIFVDDNPSPDFERWLEDQHSRVATELRQFLNIEAGLQEILIGTRHAEFTTQLRSFLDIEAGLAAIVSARELT
ncbi:hypothetical protein ACL02S_23440 [Nocardia sp. 004]|uniref:hypothetical protein n=1 Tax=Nocardia sp. 004 TaxID=3385978 RepID=UPI0039A1F2FD